MLAALTQALCGTAVQLLHKLKVRAADGSKTLLKVIKNPVIAHLPAGAKKIGTSVQGELIDPMDLVAKLPRGRPIVFVFGSHAHGPVEVDYVEEVYSFSSYGLSAATALNRLLGAFEKHWGVL